MNLPDLTEIERAFKSGEQTGTETMAKLEELHEKGVVPADMFTGPNVGDGNMEDGDGNNSDDENADDPFKELPKRTHASDDEQTNQIEQDALDAENQDRHGHVEDHEGEAAIEEQEEQHPRDRYGNEVGPAHSDQGSNNALEAAEQAIEGSELGANSVEGLDSEENSIKGQMDPILTSIQEPESSQTSGSDGALQGEP